MQESNSALPRVLVVDDDPTMTMILEKWLVANGYDCRCCASAAEGLGVLEREEYGIVVMDWHMPGMDGIDLVRSIRNRRREGGSPYLVMASGDSSPEAITASFEAGVDDFMRKPLDLAELVAHLHAANRVLSLEKELEEKARREAMRGLHRGGIRELSEVVATLAHDLRTPLGTLRMTASTLRGRIEERAPELSATAERIERVSSRMSEILDDVVSAFVADDGSNETWTRFDLAAEVVRAAELISSTVPAGTKLELPLGTFPVRGNPFGLRRLVINLVSNALRHSGASSIRVRLEADADPRWARIEVQDDGKGIASNLLPHLGEPMFLSSAAGHQEFFVRGNGLGFTICRRIAAQHGGRIVVASGPGRGTLVRVWILSGETAPVPDSDFAPIESEALP